MPKPFKFNQRIVKKKQLTSDSAAASRDTTSQAISFVCEDGAIRYNKRKIKELPGFIGLMTSNISIPLACKHIYILIMNFYMECFYFLMLMKYLRI
jgi:hypothetical protein